MKKKIIYISRSQIFSRLDINLLDNLAQFYDINAISIFNNKEKIKNSLFENNYLYFVTNSNFFFRTRRYIWFLCKIIKFTKQNNADLYYIVIFRLAFLLALLFPQKKFLLRLYTSNVSKNVIRNYIEDNITVFNCIFFKNIICGSSWIQKKFRIKPSKVYIIGPGGWGYESISTTNKSFNSLLLIYIGTLTNRNVEQTIKGFYRFYEEYKGKIDIQYTIMGTGHSEDVDKLKKNIEKYKLDNVVKYLGWVNDEIVKKYFDICNVGISYVPITSYYNNVEVTKTFEYIFSGIPVIATETNENKKVINEKNGILIQDNPDSFYLGLKEFYKRRHKFNSKNIRETCKNFSRNNAIKKQVNMIEEIINKGN